MLLTLRRLLVGSQRAGSMGYMTWLGEGLETLPECAFQGQEIPRHPSGTPLVFLVFGEFAMALINFDTIIGFAILVNSFFESRTLGYESVLTCWEVNPIEHNGN